MEYSGTPYGQNLAGYSDADWGRNPDDRRSTTGYTFIYANAATTQEALWLRKLFTDLGYMQKRPITVFEDNQSCISLAKNPTFHSRSQHIDIKHHFVREAIESQLIELAYCPTEEMVADILTKPLAKVQFELLRYKLGLRELANI